MKFYHSAIAIFALTATAALAQAGERSLLDAKKFWTSGGSEQTSKTTTDKSLPGGRYVTITSTGLNSKYSANVSYRIVNEIKKGDVVTLTGVVRAEAPTKINLNVELADKPYSKIGGGEINVTPAWTPYKVQFTASSDHAAGSARALVQLNSEARTVSFGPLSATASVGK